MFEDAFKFTLLKNVLLWTCMMHLSFLELKTLLWHASCCMTQLTVKRGWLILIGELFAWFKFKDHLFPTRKLYFCYAMIFQIPGITCLWKRMERENLSAVNNSWNWIQFDLFSIESVWMAVVVNCIHCTEMKNRAFVLLSRE